MEAVRLRCGRQHRYDERDRLTSAATQANTTGEQPSINESYGYDAIGNLTSKTGAGSYGYYGGKPHAVTHLNGAQRYWYDASGNMAWRDEDAKWWQGWDAENQLSQVKACDAAWQCPTTVVTFAYDADGNRVKKVEGGQTTVYVGDVYEQNVTTGEYTHYYYLGGQRVVIRQSTDPARGTGTVTWLHGDHLGSASLATNASGQVVSNLRYAPYGSVRWQSGAMPTTRRFTGHRSEDAIGLIDMNARFYDPLIGRFISADTIVPGAGNPQALNRYSMVFNNPLKYTDPTGHEPCAQYDATNECVVRYEALPRERVLRTRLGGYVDQQHAERTNILAQIRSATRKPGGGSVYLDGLLQGEYMRIDYLIREGLSDNETVGVSLGILLNYENQWETKQGELGIRQPMSSYSLEDLPSEYLGFVQEATGYSLVDIVNHHLGGYDATYSEVAWIAHRILIGSPTNYETRPLEVDTSPIGFTTGRHADWPITLQLGPPIGGSSGLWRVLSTSYAGQHSTGR